jgi:hypothetical protein
MGCSRFETSPSEVIARAGLSRLYGGGFSTETTVSGLSSSAEYWSEVADAALIGCCGANVSVTTSRSS